MPAISTDEEEKSRRVGLLVMKLRFRARGGVDEDEKRRDAALGRIGRMVRAVINPRPVRRGAAARKAEGGREGATATG